MKTSTLFLSFLTAALSLVPSTHAHGFVYHFGVDGTDYVGNIPTKSPNPSPIRQVSAQDPIYGATNPSVNCGNNATLASTVVNAMPGSNLTWGWNTQSLTNWPHNTGALSISSANLLHVFNNSAHSIGPIMTYLASCGNTPCNTFDSTTAKWFKIDQVGRDSSGSTWVQQQISQFLSLFSRLPGLMPIYSEWERFLHQSSEQSCSGGVLSQTRDHRPPPSDHGRQG